MEYRRAIAEAVTPKLVTAVLMKMAKKALAGDAACARLFLERVLGRVQDAPPLEDDSPEHLAKRFAASLRELDDYVPKYPLPDSPDEKYL